MQRLITALLLVCLWEANAFGYITLPKDAAGWTVFTASSDSRIMYVSSSGNDGTGQVYSKAAVGNPFQPGITVQPFATYAAAYAQSRVGYPDWILFKRGDTFTQTLGANLRNGRGLSEPALVGAYGTTGLSPVFKIGTGSFFTIERGTDFSYLALSGLKVYHHTRNPNDPDYSGMGGGHGFKIMGDGHTVSNILIEGCQFLYPIGNTIQGYNGGISRDITFRRNIIAYSYINSESGHVQGLFAGNTLNLLIEENVMYHNGWLVNGNGANSGVNGQATMFNHNFYFASSDGAIFRKNVLMHPSSSNIKMTAQYTSDDVIVEGNLAIDGECSLDMCSNYPSTDFRIGNPTVRDNVFMNNGHTAPPNRGFIAWPFWIGGWDGGQMYNNLVVNSAESVTNSAAVRFWDESRNFSIHDNVFMGPSSGTRGFHRLSTATGSGNRVEDNYFEYPGTYLVQSDTSATGVTYSGNRYYDASSPQFRIGSTNYSTTQWLANYDTTATFTQKSFPDKTRNIEKYQQSIGETATLDSFYANAIAQDRYNWDTRYSADAVNTYLRVGFGMEAGTVDPDPTCVENYSYCDTQETCEAAHWYWCNNGCINSPCTIPATCATDYRLCYEEQTCEDAGFNWCGSGPCSNQPCAPDPPDPPVVGDGAMIFEAGTGSLSPGSAVFK